MTALTITALHALPLALIYLVLWFRVTQMRAGLAVSIGDNGNVTLHERIRQHGNFVEWVPMVLILMILAESLGTDGLYLHASGALLVLGRLAHPFGLKAHRPTHALRIVGNSTNILAMVTLIVCLALRLF
ncbi:MAG TPA: MAPEG family protein [Gemmobacter sp.]|nr:MAPEG family protein [Gemmobacter sp.]